MHRVLKTIRNPKRQKTVSTVQCRGSSMGQAFVPSEPVVSYSWVLHPAQHIIGHFGHDLLSQSISPVQQTRQLTHSVPYFFWLWQKWVYQGVQRHTGLTHPFQFFWHLGTLALSPERQSAQMSKNLKRVG